MIKAPTPEEEDRRRLWCVVAMWPDCWRTSASSLRRLATATLRRDRRRRLDTLQTGDGRLLPVHLKAQVCRELDRLELLLEQIKAVEAERDVLLAAQQVAAPAPAAMLLDIKGIGPEWPSANTLAKRFG